MRKITRRQLLKRSTAALSAMVAVPYIVPSSVLGKDGSVAPSERITLTSIGCGNRGLYDLTHFLSEPDAPIALTQSLIAPTSAYGLVEICDGIPKPNDSFMTNMPIACVPEQCEFPGERENKDSDYGREYEMESSNRALCE